MSGAAMPHSQNFSCAHSSGFPSEIETHNYGTVIAFPCCARIRGCGLSGGEWEVRTGLLTVPKDSQYSTRLQSSPAENAIRNLLSVHAAFISLPTLPSELKRGLFIHAKTSRVHLPL